MSETHRRNLANAIEEAIGQFDEVTLGVTDAQTVVDSLRAIEAERPSFASLSTRGPGLAGAYRPSVQMTTRRAVGPIGATGPAWGRGVTGATGATGPAS